MKRNQPVTTTSHSKENRNTHTVYKNGDSDAPDCIKDNNGDIVLGLCRVCGAGESELYEYPCTYRNSASIPTELVSRIPNVQKPHDNSNPLWEGPWGDGWNGGITQSMIVNFLSCRERFRLKYVLGLYPHDKWNHKIGYGNMWHVCEEGLAGKGTVELPEFDGTPIGGSCWDSMLDDYYRMLMSKYPLQREEISKWYNTCTTQFPEYVEYWSDHPDTINREPLLQEEIFDVPYRLPSGRTVRLRGKWDSVDYIKDDITGPNGGIYIQENKTKGKIEKEQVERQVKYDLQTNLYLIALRDWQDLDDYGIPVRTPDIVEKQVLGVRYNVVRRPFSSGKGNISPHKAKYTKTKAIPAETMEHFYERLRRDYFAKEPGYWFFRVRAEIGKEDLDIFRRDTLDPILEQMCLWYEQVTGRYQSFRQVNGAILPQMNYRTPFGVYSSLQEGGATEYDAFMATGSEIGLRRVNELFTELKS